MAIKKEILYVLFSITEATLGTPFPFSFSKIVTCQDDPFFQIPKKDFNLTRHFYLPKHAFLWSPPLFH
jgi:hypothetical protein